MDLLVFLLEVTTWVYEMSGYRETIVMQRWAESTVLTAPSWAQYTKKNHLSTNKRDRE
jgi:hypothetical protein